MARMKFTLFCNILNKIITDVAIQSWSYMGSIINNKARSLIHKAWDVKKAVHSVEKSLNSARLHFEMKTSLAYIFVFLRD